MTTALHAPDDLRRSLQRVRTVATLGRVVQAGPAAGRRVGERVFVPGARCFGDVRGLFGGAAACLVVPGARTLPVAEHLGEQAVLMAAGWSMISALGQRILAGMREDVIDRALDLPAQTMEITGIGDALSRVADDVDGGEGDAAHRVTSTNRPV